MAYIGRDPQYGAFEKQSITADGSTTTFSLDYTVGSAASLLVSVAGVHQEPVTAYNLGTNGTQIVFSTAPASGDTVFIIFLGIALDSAALLSSSTITSQTDLTTGLQGADSILLHDNSASALKEVTLDNLIIGQTALTTTADDDVFIIYDTSATEIKKVTKSNLNFTSPGKAVAFSLIFG